MNITKKEFQMLRGLIEQQTGILLDDTKTYLIENRLSKLAVEANCKSFGELYIKLKNDPRAFEIKEKMVEAITTNETLWFRDKYPFCALTNIILPELLEKKEKGLISEIKIWSAGCSSGQEPYSIAITVFDFLKNNRHIESKNNFISILATDISDSNLNNAINGEYDEIAVQRGLLHEQLSKYFIKKNRKWKIDEKLKKLISFKKFNLKESSLRLGCFDIIFLRNVMIYFSVPFKINLLKRISKLLSKNGYLILGTGETVQGLSDDFEIIKYQGGIIYRLK